MENSYPSNLSPLYVQSQCAIHEQGLGVARKRCLKSFNGVVNFIFVGQLSVINIYVTLQSNLQRIGISIKTSNGKKNSVENIDRQHVIS